MTALVGVDAGNSRTRAAVADLDGTLLAVTEGAGASPQALGVAGSWAVIGALVTEALRRAGDPEVEAAALAVAGLDFPDEEAAFAAHPHPLGARVVVVNDVLAVLRSGAPDGEGIAVVVGAGMNAVGRRGGEQVRFAALGAVSGDWGGGLVLGEAALGAACRAQDGRGPSTALEAAAPAALGFADVRGLLLAVHRGALARSELVHLAPVVLALADEGDPVSRGLAHRQADEVVALVTATERRFGLGRAETGDLPVVLAGGVLAAGCRELDDRVRAALPGRRLVVPAQPPVVGAVLLARDALRGH